MTAATPPPVTRNTRAPRKGRLIVCPHCGGIARVFHFSWCGLGCIHCGLFGLMEPSGQCHT